MTKEDLIKFKEHLIEKNELYKNECLNKSEEEIEYKIAKWNKIYEGYPYQENKKNIIASIDTKEAIKEFEKAIKKYIEFLIKENAIFDEIEITIPTACFFKEYLNPKHPIKKQ